MKTCTKCGASKEPLEFPAHARSADGRNSWCRSCMAAGERARWASDPEAYRARRRERRKLAREANPEVYRAEQQRYRERHAKRLRLKDQRRACEKHGLSLEDYKTMLLMQGGRCATCGFVAARQRRSLDIDHDHDCCPGTYSCGRCVRGLLCSGCNNTLGRVRDNASLLRSLASYVEVTA